MSQMPPLIQDLGLILSVAAVTTLVFKRIRQPLVLGYIVAGFLVSPHVKFMPTVTDEVNIRTWSEIGVIFLLFGLGLEFSFKKLVQVGGAAAVTAITTVLFMLGAGYATGQLLGWSGMDSVFLGGILSISSTTIIVRAFDELGLKTRGFARLVVGALVIEDLVAIVLLVLLSTVAVGRQFEGTALVLEMSKLALFLALWSGGGIFLIPTFFARTRRLMNDETLLVVTIALCLAMASLAVMAGFGAALGAFIMGSVLAETLLAERIEHLTRPVKDLFGAIFFVSVGMLLDPQVLREEWGPVLLISLVTVLGQPLSSGAGALLAGQPLKRAVQAGMSLSQIGEFSFIIATLGLTLGVTSPKLYPIAVAVSVLTTFVTPYMIRGSEGMAVWLTRTLPPQWVAALDRYSQQTDQVRVTSDWRKLLQAYGLNVGVLAVLGVSVILIGERQLLPWSTARMGARTGALVAGLLTLAVLLPVVWAMTFRRIQRAAYRHLWLNRRALRGPLVMIEAGRIVAAVVLLSLLVNRFFGAGPGLLAAVLLLALAVVLFRRGMQAFYQRLERHFLFNFQQRERRRERPELAPWDLHLAEVQVPLTAAAVGRTLHELSLRERHGVNIALIERGERTIQVPGREERLMPGDNLVLIGTDEQLAAASATLNESPPESGAPTPERCEMKLMKYRVLPRSPLIGRTIRSSGIREEGSALVTGLERDAQRIPNPDGAMVLQQDDLLWLAGDADRLRAFMHNGKALRE
ncbi:MAG: cation:proton antiporter [Flavobacteriales bacterium]|nr:cation:proton antiporter [Flavobacteriales bacterium]